MRSSSPTRSAASPGRSSTGRGDVARQRPDGEIEFLGRVDEQVQIQGNRVELGEISATLHRHPAVRSSLVVLDDHVPDERRLIAYVVPTGGRRPDTGQLRAHLAQHLPNYMIPGAFVCLEELPVTPNGKVDRAALPAPSAAKHRAALRTP